MLGSIQDKMQVVLLRLWLAAGRRSALPASLMQVKNKQHPEQNVNFIFSVSAWLQVNRMVAAQHMHFTKELLETIHLFFDDG